MIVHLLLQAAPVLVVPVIDKPRELTPELLTKPINHFVCRMVGEAGHPYRLVWQIEGMQGYRTEPSSQFRDGYVTSTPAAFRILEDQSGQLGSFSYSDTRSRKKIGGAIFRDNSGSEAVLQWDNDPGDQDTKASTQIYLYKRGVNEPEVFSGPCTVTKIAQAPLVSPPRTNSQ